jgi:uncharacterized protein (TIGR02145 family)
MSTVTQCCNTTGATFTKPDATVTFTAFSPCSATPVGTKWYLTDERDSKTYKVLMMPDNRMWMAQNLNYQGTGSNSLTWRLYPTHPSTVTGSNSALIGSFWCPAYNGGTSAKTSCDTWGALYSWETAMSFDGKGSWTEVATYDGIINHGRNESGAIGGRGICPPNWHVPTDNEWGILLNNMESTTSTAHTTEVNAWIGTDAGERAKAKTTCASDGTCATDSHPYWSFDATAFGKDDFGFCVLPAGYRAYDGAAFLGRGVETMFWTSASYDAGNSWRRTFSYTRMTVNRGANLRSYGFSVRCIKN